MITYISKDSAKLITSENYMNYFHQDSSKELLLEWQNGRCKKVLDN